MNSTFSIMGLKEAISWSLPTLSPKDVSRIHRTAVRAIITGGKNPRVSIRKFKASYSGAFRRRPPITANVVIKSALENDACWKEIEPCLTSTGVTVVHLN